ncbi:transglutaminase domain-containing protein [Hymenobacter psychrophilus]|uniref:Transglutaminase-like enzyme, putative cysteine protease n=1 Tax=Hymenobacter psychrophilus TaxID=651662 RepID=A0A1H3FF15_9BACT|nr:transglutaminase domain-containing protein [Hymenobacter psychrophilus]SDX89612.1 Transglutaminase-like enzyme, putative cysteine protease [Hymenobacter psychrophilus]
MLRRQLLLVGLAGATTGLARAQEAPLKFGKLDAREAAALLAQPTPDSAAAEVLCDFGQSRIRGKQDGFELRFERTARLLIRRSEGYEHATVRVVLYHDKENGREQISQLKGFTYHLAGTQLSKEPLKTEAVFSRKLDENHDEYAFTLPNVRAGAILEFTYLLTSPFLFNLQDWRFQHDIPVRWSEYRVAIPSFYTYKEMTRTYLPFTVNETGIEQYRTSYQQSGNGFGTSPAYAENLTLTAQALTRRWVLKNAPSFHQEALMTTERDYMSRVDFELERIQFDASRDPVFQVGTWAQIEAQLLRHADFGGFLERDSPLQARAGTLSVQPDPTARAKAVRQLLLESVAYNSTPALYASTPPRRVLELRQGNAADLNLLLVALLRQAGLDAQPLLLSTRGNGRIQTELPMLSQFNYVVAHVALPGGKELLLDATDASLTAGLLPAGCLNEQGRLLGPKGRWVSLAPAAPHFVYTQAKLVLAPTGELSGTIRQEYSGYAAAEHRQPVATLRQQWQKNHPDWQLDQAPLPAAAVAETDANSPVVLHLQARLPGPESSAPTMYLRPLQALSELSNPFRAATRMYPVDFAVAPRLEQHLELTLPAGYTATALPASMQLALPNNGGKFVFQTTPNGPGQLLVVSRLQLTKTRYSAQEYQALREFYTKALAKIAEPIVLQRQ